MKCLTLILLGTANAFVPKLVPRGDTTRLFLEDHIADLIDQELHRQAHKKDFEREWMEKNRGAVLHSLGGGSGSDDNENMMMNFVPSPKNENGILKSAKGTRTISMNHHKQRPNSRLHRPRPR